MKMNKSNKKIIKIGSYSIGLTAFAIAIVIVLNLFIGQLPSNIIKPDMTADAILTFGDETKKLVSEIKEDITIYHVVKEGNEQPYIEELLQRYKAESSKIKVQKIDPVKKPTFTAEYTKDQLSDNSLIVVSEKRSTVIDGEEFFLYEPTGYEGTFITYTEYINYAKIYAQSGYSFTATEYFLGEKEISGAIDYVSNEILPVVYQLAGHGETAFGTAFTQLTETENVEMKSLTLIAGETVAVPADAKAVFINVPQSDITEEEYKALKKYLDEGGYIILTTYGELYNAEKTPNFTKLTDYMGLKASADIIMEDSADHYYQAPYYLLPEVQSAGITGELAGQNYTVLSMYASPIEETKAENRSVTPLFKTSDKAYIYDESITDISKVEKSKYNVAYQSQIANSETGETAGTLIWFSSFTMFDDQMASFGNSFVYTTILQKTCGKTTSINVAGKAISNPMLNVTAADALVGYTAYVVIIPLAFLVTGFVLWIKRRRK